MTLSYKGPYYSEFQYRHILFLNTDIWRPFDPVFIKRLKSAYRDEWSFRTTHSQLDALALSGDDDLKHEALDSHSVGLMADNPLHLPDFWLAGIETATNRMFDYLMIM